jgi:Fe-S-cluster containining protein
MVERSWDYITDLSQIAAAGERMQDENFSFRTWLTQQSFPSLDEQVFALNKKAELAIDCTKCGNCCRTLIIDVASSEIALCATAMRLEQSDFKEKYIEESQQGRMFINSVPCHFFSDNKCTIYSLRFADCRDFPSLHKSGFKDRLLGTLLHYGRCPIVYNVIEQLKVELGFNISD